MPLTRSLLVFILSAPAFADSVEAPNIRVDYTGLSREWAQSIAQTLSAARDAYVREFAFDMPETIRCTVTVGEDQPTRLFTDGRDRVFLSLKSEKQLAKPSASGVFNLYGLCHEVGHMAQYRLLADRDWMTTAAAEGWAHFAGSVVVDEVHKSAGEKLWADPYDYRTDGLARLSRQRKAAIPADTITIGAGHWQDLDTIIGRKKFAELFRAWQSAKIDSSDPAALKDVLVKLAPEKSKEVETWWTSASPVLIEKRAKSAVAKQEIAASKLSGAALALKGDDDAPDGKRSLGGGAHARRFDAPGDGAWYLTAISVHGARYGPARAPATDFDIVLCDEQLKPIATWKKPYGAFERGDMKWTRIEVPPTRVPAKFAVAVVFRPTASSGIFVSSDTSTSGQSFTSVPGKAAAGMDNADWMIRVEVDRAKESDALK